jgi:hypothetical protein
MTLSFYRLWYGRLWRGVRSGVPWDPAVDLSRNFFLTL